MMAAIGSGIGESSAADAHVRDWLMQEAEKHRQEIESQALVTVYLVTRRPGETYETWLARQGVERNNGARCPSCAE